MFYNQCSTTKSRSRLLFTEKFSTDRKELCDNPINVYEVEKEIWNKNSKIWFFKNPFYYWDQEKIIKTLIEIINVLIEKNNEFFEIKIK